MKITKSRLKEIIAEEVTKFKQQHLPQQEDTVAQQTDTVQTENVQEIFGLGKKALSFQEKIGQAARDGNADVDRVAMAVLKTIDEEIKASAEPTAVKRTPFSRKEELPNLGADPVELWMKAEDVLKETYSDGFVEQVWDKLDANFDNLEQDRKERDAALADKLDAAE